MSLVNVLQNKIVSIIMRSHTWFTVTKLRLMGRKIKIGKGTIFSLSARIHPGNGVIVMGDNCYIGAGTILRASGGKICLSDNVTIGEYCMLHGQGKIFMGRNTLVATHASFIPTVHNISRRDIPIRHQGVKIGGIWIGRDCWIGSGARILNNIRLKDGTIIGTGAVVTKSTEAYGIYAGAPARKLRERD